MHYKYIALTPEGKKNVGIIEATSETEALNLLKERNLIPLELKKKRNFLSNFYVKRTGIDDLILFTEQLYRLISAGTALDKSLYILQKIFLASKNKKLENICAAILKNIKKGKSLSESLILHQNLFPNYYIFLIKAAEEAGQLPEILFQLNTYLKEKKRIQQEINSALLYPVFLIIFGLLAVQTILVFILPKFAVIFDQLGTKPPAFTNFLIKTGLFWKNYGHIFLILFLIFFIFGLKWIRSEENRRTVEKLLLSIPILGNILVLVDISRTFRGLSIMLKGGVPLEKAFEIASEISSMLLIKTFFKDILSEIKKGEKISSILQKLPSQVNFTANIIAIGEETGNLANSFYEAAILCEENFRNITDKFLKLLEPITILFFGIIIGSLILSILLAIFNVNF